MKVLTSNVVAMASGLPSAAQHTAATSALLMDPDGVPLSPCAVCYFLLFLIVGSSVFAWMAQENFLPVIISTRLLFGDLGMPLIVMRNDMTPR